MMPRMVKRLQNNTRRRLDADIVPMLSVRLNNTFLFILVAMCLQLSMSLNVVAMLIEEKTSTNTETQSNQIDKKTRL